ncbi:NAD-dependent epimerase/dehydratase family protein [Amycolatopsis thermoflava]|uniref:NAD-dependent epimerase/dehydratase family protein n=1 Tax=Amycolatopsis thermoflava TaxID=84480 RepID=UPI00380735EE
MTDETVLVTGGTGYLAGWCIDLLLARGYHVRATVRDRSRRPVVAAQLPALHPTARLTVVEADLGSDAGWAEAAAGCDFVLHVASPFPAVPPRDPAALVGPARDGTLRVLAAARAAGARRIVVTSSSSAAAYPAGPRPDPITEDHWTDPGHPLARAYVRSKTLAERAAWAYAREHGMTDRLTVIAPGTLLGPVRGRPSYSLSVVERLVTGRMPGLPRLGFPFTDVRDVAALHVAAMLSRDAAGERFLAAGPFHWIEDIAAILRGQPGARVPSRRLPGPLVRAAALFDPALRQVVPELGEEFRFATGKARDVLGWNPRPLADTVLDCARSFVRARSRVTA